MLDGLLLVIGVIYAIQIFLFALAVWNAHPSSHPSFRPAVSIIIAARNEEQNIRQCLESISRLSYPPHLLDVVFVDDRSTDSTHAIIQEFAQSHPHCRVIVAAEGSEHLRGKSNAVVQGIESSKGEFLLFTDADCVVPEYWVEETVGQYEDDTVGLVAGFTSLRPRSWFESMQALDWFFLYSVAAGVLRLNFPVTAVGNNLSVRRKAYDHVGGFRKIPFSVTEDYALFHAITSDGTYTARFALNEATLVESHGCETWAQLYRQKKRWFVGGRDMHASRLLVFGVAYLFNVLLLYAMLAPGVSFPWVALTLKVVPDFFMTLPSRGGN